ncbi:MAG: DNA polymerase III subunit beta [Crenarchaeota archaeon]|nr:DNA polymerase III subunit beta [Thermoproteota archaeon]
MFSRLRVLREWRRFVEVVVEAVKRVEPEARVYLVGGAAEGRLTVLSDIDVVVVLPRELGFEEAAELRARIWEEAEKLGLPLYAPIDLHIVSVEGLRKYVRRGRVVELG